MIREINTDKAAQPFSNYAQAIAVDPAQPLVFVSGQVGADADGIIAVLPEHQHELAWQNVLAILAAEGMDHRNIVDAHVYITDRRPYRPLSRGPRPHATGPSLRQRRY